MNIDRETKVRAYIQRFIMMPKTEKIPVGPDLVEYEQPQQKDKESLKKWARLMLSRRTDTERFVHEFIKDNKEDLINRRGELSVSQIKTLDKFLYLESLVNP